MVSARYPPNEAPTLFPVANTILRTPAHSVGERVNGATHEVLTLPCTPLSKGDDVGHYNTDNSIVESECGL